MDRVQDSELEFLETAVLDLDIETQFADEDYDGDSTDVMSDDILRRIQLDLD